jgi:biofilm protein TabA
MFLGHLHQKQTLPTEIEKAIHHLRTTDYTNIAPGRYPIDGEDLIAIVQDPITQAWETGFPEFHARYIDVQYLLSGEEALGYLPANHQLPPSIDHLQDKDIAFVAAQENETRIVLTAGMFAVFYPGELHRPCRAVHQPMRIKKVVMKIALK